MTGRIPRSTYRLQLRRAFTLDQAADLVDYLHVVTVPVVLGEGTALWDGLGGVHERFDIETVASPSGRTHQFWNRKRG